MQISKPVGDKRYPRVKNLKDDVLLVQVSFNLLLPANEQLDVDGICGPKTVAVINWFQENFVALPKPDGVIDPGGVTFKTLMYKTQHRVFYDAFPSAVLDSSMRYKTNRFAKDYYFESGVKLRQPTRVTVTSGIRTSASQAGAMFRKFHSGGDYKIYRNRVAAKEIYDQYVAGKALGLGAAENTRRMKLVIDGQMQRGVYISMHLKSGAVDFRSRTLTAAQKALFMSLAERHVDVVLLERFPPHFHVQFKK